MIISLVHKKKYSVIEISQFLLHLSRYFYYATQSTQYMWFAKFCWLSQWFLQCGVRMESAQVTYLYAHFYDLPCLQTNAKHFTTLVSDLFKNF